MNSPEIHQCRWLSHRSGLLFGWRLKRPLEVPKALRSSKKLFSFFYRIDDLYKFFSRNYPLLIVGTETVNFLINFFGKDFCVFRFDFGEIFNNVMIQGKTIHVLAGQTATDKIKT